jgi:DNA-directed RNA polymerase sigma subunit (sigma70/sigma32)
VELQVVPTPDDSTRVSPSDRLDLEEAQRTPRLTRVEVAALERALAEDKSGAAADRLIRAHLHIVARLARKFASRGIPLADLFEMGAIALRHAVARYDPRRNTRFTAFVVARVRRAMRRLSRLRPMGPWTAGHGPAPFATMPSWPPCTRPH